MPKKKKSNLEKPFKDGWGGIPKHLKVQDDDNPKMRKIKNMIGY